MVEPLPTAVMGAVVAMRAAHDKAANLDCMQCYVQQAADAGVRLLVFPEASLQGFLFDVDIHFDPNEAHYHWQNAEPVPGPSTDLVAEWAAAHNMVIVFGLMERFEHPAVPVLYNSAAVVGPQGVLGVYRKVHQPSEERFAYRPGDEWPVIQTPVGRLGTLICYDQCFPEAARELTLRGAEILALPNAWSKLDQASDDRYDFFGRARAAENCRWLLQANLVGSSDHGTHTYLGYSRIIDPQGQVVAATTPGEEGLAITEVQATTYDPAHARSGWLLQQRRPDTYRTLADTSFY